MNCLVLLFWCQLLPGLHKTWTLDWTGVTKTAVYRQRTTPRLQQFVPSSASSCCWVLEASSSWFPRGQRSCACLMSFNKGGSGWHLVGSVNGFERPWLVSTVSYGGRMHLLGKHHQSLIDLWLKHFTYLKESNFLNRNHTPAFIEV